MIIFFIKLFINEIENFQVLKNKNQSPFLCLIYIGYGVKGNCYKFTYKYYKF